ncbi:MAG: ShlB/FhaC/HecB family hemolysin secretion/activation protein [Gammaproteobacteria bacterium]
MAQPAEPILPQVTFEAGDQKSAVERGERVFINAYNISGNTVLDKDLLNSIILAYVNRDVLLTEISELRDKLTLAYVEHGYVSSGAVIDLSTVPQGLLSIQIVEGVISRVQIDTDGRLRNSYLRKRIQSSGHEVFNIAKTERNLQILQQNHRIESLQSQLLPGAHAGQSILEVGVREARPYSAMLESSNYESPNVGAERALIAVAHSNISGYGDRLDFDVRKSKGLTAWHANYAVPISAKDVTVFLDAQMSESEIVEDDFASLDINSEADIYSLGIDYPVYRSERSQFGLFASLDRLHSKSFLLGTIPFSFSEGVENGEARITALRLGQSWNQRSRQRAIALQSTFSVGIDALDATVNSDDIPDGTFLKWLFQSQWAQRVPWLGSQIIARGDLQLSESALLGLEKFALGGHNSVRGYRENIFSGDNGVIASVEWRVPLFSRRGGDQSVALAPFLDTGYVRNRRASNQSKSLSSAGLGLHGRFSRHAQVNIHWAKGFESTGGSGDLQDDGLHLQARFQF